MKYIIPTLLTILLFAQCRNNDLFFAEGQVADAKSQLSEVTIIIDGDQALTDETDQNGAFKIEDLPSGKHELTMAGTNSNGESFENSIVFTINDDNINLGTVNIDLGPLLKEPSSIELSGTEIIWEPSIISGFTEYRLYRSTDAGLTSESGDLLFVGTDLNDTVYNDEDLDPLSTYYYRCYAVNTDDDLIPSDIISFNTEGAPVIHISFDDEDISENWNTKGGIIKTEITQDAKVGDNALYNQNDSCVYSSLKTKKSFKLKPGFLYEISGWLRVSGQKGDMGTLWILLEKTTDGETPIVIKIEAYPGGFCGNYGVEDTGWKYASETFSVSTESNYKIDIYCSYEHSWVDEISLNPIEKLN